MKNPEVILTTIMKSTDKVNTKTIEIRIIPIECLRFVIFASICYMPRPSDICSLIILEIGMHRVPLIYEV